MKKAVPLIEVSVVVGLFFTFRSALKSSNLADWQQSTFGAAPVSSSLLFFALPLVFDWGFTDRSSQAGFG